MNSKIFEEVKALMIEELGVDSGTITPEASIITDLSINSLELMNVIVAIEEKYDIIFSESVLSGIQTIGDFVSCIEALTS